MRKIFLAAATALATAAPWGFAAHANLVQNGDFSSEPSGPPVSPPTDWGASGNAGADQNLPNTGDTWDGFLGDNTGSLYQTLTTPGTAYTLSFAVAADSAAFGDASGNGGFFVCFDPTATSCAAGSDLFSGNILGDLGSASTYLTFSTPLTATASSMVLSFTGSDDNGGTYYLADVDVEPTTATPEPSGILVLAAALGGIALLRRRVGITA